MSWQPHSYGPVEPPVSRPEARNASPAPMRFLGVAGFSVAGLLTWLLGTRLLGLPTDVWRQHEWSGPTAALAVATVLLGLLGAVAGAAVGLTLPVRGPRANFILTVLWHYCATGSLAWLFTSGLVIQRALDDEALRRMQNGPEAVRLLASTIGIGAGGSLIVAALLLALRLLRETQRANLLLCVLVAAMGTRGMLMLQTVVTPPVGRFGLVLTLLFPAALVLFASWFIARDLQSRRQVQGDR